MTTFSDNAGRAWDVVVHVLAVKRVRAALGVDLYRLVDDGLKGLGELLADPVLLVDVLYVLCREAAESSGVSDEDFGRSLAGDALERAAQAFLEALTDFFPDRRARQALRTVTRKGREMRERMLDVLGTRLEEVDAASTAATSSGSSGGSPASPASTPTGSPSASST